MAATAYQRAPWLKNHVLALRVSGGQGVGDLGGRRIFALGGLTVRDPLLDLLLGGRTAAVALRGYRRSAFAGSSFVLGNAEYRFPIWDVERGAWTLPIYLRRLHGALFVDVGRAADRIRPADLKVGAGAELRAEVTLGYYLTTHLRFGYGRGFSPGGIDDFYLGLGGYF